MYRVSSRALVVGDGGVYKKRVVEGGGGKMFEQRACSGTRSEQVRSEQVDNILAVAVDFLLVEDDAAPLPAAALDKVLETVERLDGRALGRRVSLVAKVGHRLVAVQRFRRLIVIVADEVVNGVLVHFVAGCLVVVLGAMDSVLVVEVRRDAVDGGDSRFGPARPGQRRAL